jgi:hypothetical protein
VANFDDAGEPRDCLFVHLIAAEKIGIVGKVAQEPTYLLESFGGAIKASIERPTLQFSRFEHRKAEIIEWLLSMPTILSFLHSN